MKKGKKVIYSEESEAVLPSNLIFCVWKTHKKIFLQVIEPPS